MTLLPCYLPSATKALDPAKYFVVTFALFCNGEVWRLPCHRLRLNRDTDVRTSAVVFAIEHGEYSSIDRCRPIPA